ncbi:MAG: NUDIX hydrolase [Chloroflexota bacterium]|nr:NUDIX hydrolase [Chloroflexota bacterium]
MSDPDASAAAREPASPWRRHARTIAYDNAWIQVLHDEVTRPDGQPGIYGVVHFRNRAVGVVAVDDQDRVVLVGQHRYTMDHYSWEIPEGGVPIDEDPLDGARRELREETGLEAVAWRLIGQIELSNSITDETGLFYLATGLTQGEAAPEATEDLRLRWVQFTEIPAMIDRGELPDALTQLALERVARLRAAERTTTEPTADRTTADRRTRK